MILYVFDKSICCTSGIKKSTDAWNKQKRDYDKVLLSQQLPGNEM